MRSPIGFHKKTAIPGHGIGRKSKGLAMIIVTTNDLPGYKIDAVFGEVMGLTVRSRHVGAQFTASFRALGGGEEKAVRAREAAFW